MKSLEEKVAVVQIPEDVVKTISDEGLIETILQFPLLNLDAYNSEEIAYWHLYNQCNGVPELLTRKHARSALEMAYEDETDQLRKRVLKLLLSKLSEIESEG